MLVSGGVLCVATLFVTSSHFIEASTRPKWYAGAAACSLLIIVSCFCRRAILPPVPWLFGTAVIVCTVLALRGLVTFIKAPFFDGLYGIREGFDNPAGFASAMCFVFPLTLYFLRKEQQRWVRIGAAVAGLLLVMGIVLSFSRTALMTLCVATFFWLYHRRHIRYGYAGILAFCVCALVAGLYWVKKDSADGRFLVWSCSWQMIKQHPLIGYGLHGFMKNYMNFQAAYFKDHPESHFGSLAADTFRPFNEYLRVVIDFGFIGLLLLTAFVVIIIIKFRQHKTAETTAALTCLTAISVFSLSSYPLSYPFTWVILGISLFVLFQPEKYVLPRLFRSSLKFVLLSFSLITLYYTYRQTVAEMQWCELAHQDGAITEKELFDGYRRLWPALKNNYLFVYNVAAELNSHGLYDQSLAIADVGTMECADYDMQLIMADNYFQLKNYTAGERHYQWASYMCPNRFMPLHGLFRLYLATGQKDRALAMALLVKNKPIKINSPTVSDIKAEMLRYLNSR